MAQARPHLYLIALGSNQRHHRHGGPRHILQAALDQLAAQAIKLLAVSPTIRSRPIGPSQRDYANAAALVETILEPDALLDALKSLEQRFGRRQTGRKWRARALDLDIILWSGGCWQSTGPDLDIPHGHYHKRAFVLAPARQIAPDWRDPVSGHTISHLFHQLNRPKRLDHRRSPP